MSEAQESRVMREDREDEYKKEKENVTPWINTLMDEVLLYCYGGII
jgi:hypothetical protein